MAVMIFFMLRPLRQLVRLGHRVHGWPDDRMVHHVFHQFSKHIHHQVEFSQAFLILLRRHHRHCLLLIDSTTIFGVHSNTTIIYTARCERNKERGRNNFRNRLRFTVSGLKTRLNRYVVPSHRIYLTKIRRIGTILFLVNADKGGNRCKRSGFC